MTSRIEWGQKPEHLQFLEKALGVSYSKEPHVMWLASVDENDEVLGVVAYTRFSSTNCEMSVAAASPRFLNRANLRSFFGYPFHQLQLKRVTAVVEVTNKHAYKFDRKLGFQVEGVLRQWFPTCDGIVMGLLKEECKWL